MAKELDPKYKFVEKDIDGLKKVYNAMSDQDQETLGQLVEQVAANDSLNTIEKRQEFLKALMATSGIRSWTKQAMPEVYKEALKLERGDAWKPNLKDVQKALNLTDDELYDAEKGWQGIAGKDLDFLAESEGMDIKDIMPILREAQIKHDRQKAYENTPWYEKLLANYAGPFTAEKLSKGEEVNDMLTADKVGLLAGIIPAGKYVAAAGPIARTVADAALAPTAAAITGLVTDELTPKEALEAGAMFGTNLAGGAAVKGGFKGMKGLGASLSKSGRSVLNESEDALKEGFYRADLEGKLKRIQKALDKKDLEGITSDDVKLLKTFNAFRDLGPELDLSQLGKFSQKKLDNYLAKLKELSPGLYERRQSIKADLADPVEQVHFDVNPGTIRPYDIFKNIPEANLKKVGYGRSGLGSPRQSVNATLKGHEGITNVEIPRLDKVLREQQFERLSHTDPYYPRVSEMDKDITNFINSHPQLKAYFSKNYKDPAVRDYLVQVLIPNLMSRSAYGIGKNTIYLEKEKK